MAYEVYIDDMLLPVPTPKDTHQVSRPEQDGHADKRG